MDAMTNAGQSGKPVWRSPRLEELGNLRDFVRSGNAFGKSGAPADGSSDPGGESMPMN
ncbi:MAG: hypothetical protein ACT4QD_14505 [Acidobacteriota bacterium]